MNETQILEQPTAKAGRGKYPRKPKAESTVVQVAPETSIAATAVQPEVSPANKKDAELIKRAELARRQRKQAPLIDVSTGHASIPQKDVIARFAKSQGGNRVQGGMYYFMGDVTQMDRYASRGAAPVMDMGERVYVGQDPLMCIPTELQDEEDLRDKKQSDRMLTDWRKQQAKDRSATDPGKIGDAEIENKRGDAREVLSST